MSTQITVPFVSQFRSQVEHLNQQDGSRLRGAVRLDSISGEKSFYEQLASTVATKRTSRHSDTPRVDSGHQRRMVLAADFEWSDLIDKQDKIRLLAEFNNPYAKAAAMAIGRAQDQEIITAALGNAYTGHDGTTSVGIGAANQIAVNFGGSNSGLTIGKLRQANYLLSANNNDTSEPWYIAGTARQKLDLLATTEVTSSDYNTVRALVNGEINSFLGFNFIWTEEFQNVASAFDSTNDINYIFAWRKSGLLLATGQEINIRMDELPTKSYSTQIYASATFGATRMQEGSVIQIACDRSP